MDEFGFSLGAAFLGGLLSFLSPCVLPLVPGYLCFAAGIGFEELSDADENVIWGRILPGALAFVAGFSVVFISLGAGAAAINPFILGHKDLLAQIAGVFIVILGLHMAEPVERYIVELILASRNPPADLAPLLELGASPRGTIGLDLCARANAWLAQRDFVTPEDVQAVAHDVLRHRLICSFEANAQGLDSDYVITQLLEQVPVP